MNDVELVSVNVTGMKLSTLLWRHRDGTEVGLLERVLDLNPGLSADVVLPIGVDVKVPYPASSEISPPNKLVRIFG